MAAADPAVPRSFDDTLKPERIETPLDRALFRPLAHLVVRAALPAPVPPAAITALGAVVGLAGASLLRFPNLAQLAPGAALLALFGVLDCADGQLARARGTASRTGRILDGAAKYLVGVAATVAVAARLEPEGGAWLAIAGFASIALQGTLGDYFHGRFLARSGATYREGDDLEETEEEIPALDGVSAALHRAYALFVRAQRALGGERTSPLVLPGEAIYAEALGPIAQGFAYLGGSVHLALLVTFASIGQLGAYLWIRLTVGNVALVALYFEHHRREHALAPSTAPSSTAPSNDGDDPEGPLG